jgi:hypothetical protein
MSKQDVVREAVKAEIFHVQYGLGKMATMYSYK